MGRRIAGITLLLLAMAACSKGSTTSAPGGAGGGVAGAPGGASGGAGGGMTVDGTLTTSGLYSASWAWQAGLAADVGDLGSITLKSDKGTYANISVKHDGGISFGSGAPELTQGSNYTGAGAQVKLGKLAYVCSFTVNNDLTGTDGTALYIQGGLTIHLSDSITPCP